MRRTCAALTALSLLALAPSAEAAAPVRATATFVGGSGSYLTGAGTDGLRRVSGQVQLRQTKPGATITARGDLTGLAPTTTYVAVPYRDGFCTPVPGVTAYPSGPFTTDRAGRARFATKVNPRAVNPAGRFDVRDTRSVSVRQVVISSVALPGIPVGTPTVPNVAQPEACDKTPAVR